MSLHPPEHRQPRKLFPDWMERRYDDPCVEWSVEQARKRRRQIGIDHVHDCGPRAMLELHQAVERGQNLNDVLEDFYRLPSRVYHAVEYATQTKTVSIDKYVARKG
jgi:hypothetical protein